MADKNTPTTTPAGAKGGAATSTTSVAIPDSSEKKNTDSKAPSSHSASRTSLKTSTTSSNHSNPDLDNDLDIYPTISHHDMPNIQNNIHPTTTGDNDTIYMRFTPQRKRLIVFVVSFCSFLAPISSATVLSAVPEVAETYDCDGSVINLSNGLYLLFMGLSPCLYGPLSTIYGRRVPALISAALFFAFSISTALAPNLASFFIFRLLTAFQGTSFLIIGSAVIGDIYKPTERGTALGFYLSGTLVGPALGPFIGGIIVTYRSWRDIFWLQTALAGAGALLCLFFLPETVHHQRSVELEGLPRKQKARTLWYWLNPVRIVLLYRYPNLLVVGLAASSLVWNMYSLLTPIRYTLNPRFELTTPLQSALFYLAPGAGYLTGTFFGGRFADHYVRRYIRLRSRRVPEDRLRSCLIALGLVIPGCMLIYGWSVEKRVGGIALPVIVMFIQGVAQLFCFPSLNTYCLDVMQKKGRSAEVVAGNFLLRYLFGAAGSAVCLPAVRKIGVGWFSTISAGFLIVSAGMVWCCVVWGERWREGVDGRKEERERRRAGEKV